MGARGGGVWMTVAAVWAVVVVLLFIQGGAAAQEPPYDAQVSITSDTLRVRTGPSTNSAVMGGLPNGRGVRVLDRSDGWAYIQSGDTEGWVAERFLRPASDVGADRPAATPRPRASGRPGQACALGRLAVRSATPGMDARRLDGNRCLVSTSAGSVVVQRVVVREDGKQINIQALNQFTKQQTGHTFLPYLFFDAMSVFSAPEFLVGARPNLVWRADRDQRQGAAIVSGGNREAWVFIWRGSNRSTLRELRAELDVRFRERPIGLTIGSAIGLALFGGALITLVVSRRVRELLARQFRPFFNNGVPASLLAAALFLLGFGPILLLGVSTPALLLLAAFAAAGYAVIELNNDRPLLHFGQSLKNARNFGWLRVNWTKTQEGTLSSQLLTVFLCNHFNVACKRCGARFTVHTQRSAATSLGTSVEYLPETVPQDVTLQLQKEAAAKPLLNPLVPYLKCGSLKHIAKADMSRLDWQRNKRVFGYGAAAVLLLGFFLFARTLAGWVDTLDIDGLGVVANGLRWLDALLRDNIGLGAEVFLTLLFGAVFWFTAVRSLKTGKPARTFVCPEHNYIIDDVYKVSGKPFCPDCHKDRQKIETAMLFRFRE